jgi:hypothetical protein
LKRAPACEAADALDKAGLGATALQTVGDFFPGQRVQQFAKKTDLCAGAEPFRHSHFFTQSGQFGSLDQNLNRVDNGTYTLINADTVRINQGTFHYRITGGDTLTLDPVITGSLRTWHVTASVGVAAG